MAKELYSKTDKNCMVTTFLIIFCVLSFSVNIFLLFIERKKKKQLAQANSAIINSMRFGVIETDVHGVIQMINPAACHMLGYEACEIVGKANPSMIHLNDEIEAVAKEMGIDPGFEVFVKNSREKNIVETRDWTYCRKDRSKFTSRLSVSTLRDGKKIFGYVGVFEDVSFFKQWEMAQELKDQFLAKVGHELRTPLNAILGLAGLALDSKSDEERLNYIKKMKSSGESLADFINRVLDFSKVDKGMMSLSPTVFHLNELLDEIVASYRSQAEGKDLAFIVESNLVGRVEVLGDSLRLKQILSNFFSNSIKFTEQGKICFDIEYDDYVLDLSIEDTGIGISEKNLSKLFSPFFQGDEDINHRFGGTGLGLAISHELIEMMGGSIYVESTEGVGTKFYIKIPMTRIHRKEELHDQSEGQVIIFPPEKSKVLVVEDNKINQLVISKILEKWGLKVDVVENGKESLKKMNDGYNLVLMDMQMPVMDGVTATKIWRKAGCFVPIIALTANSFETEKQTCLDAGMDDFVAKPINPEGLKKLIKKHLAS